MEAADSQPDTLHNSYLSDVIGACRAWGKFGKKSFFPLTEVGPLLPSPGLHGAL